MDAEDPLARLIGELTRRKARLEEARPEIEADGKAASKALRDAAPDSVDLIKEANRFLFSLARRTGEIELLEEILPRLEAAAARAAAPADAEAEAESDPAPETDADADPDPDADADAETDPGAAATEAVLEAQEEERRRTSIRIHDGPAQHLANVMMRLEFCERLSEKDPEKARRELRDVRDELEGVLSEIRRLIFDLRPMTLDDLGLLPTLQRFVENEKLHAPFSLQLIVRGPSHRFPPRVETHLYRILQEGLWNAARHGEPGEVFIRLSIDPDQLRMAVEDDGAGFDPAEAEPGTGMAEIRRRVEALGGEVRWVSAPGEGCTLEVTAPRESAPG